MLDELLSFDMRDDTAKKKKITNQCLVWKQICFEFCGTSVEVKNWFAVKACNMTSEDTHTTEIAPDTNLNAFQYATFQFIAESLGEILKSNSVVVGGGNQ